MATLSKVNPGRIFEVINGQLGPWPQGSAFSEYEFRRIHPAPKRSPDADPDDIVPTADEYYAAAFERLLKAEGNRPQAIRQVADRKPEPTPVGPEMNPPKASVNPLIGEVARAIADNQAKEADAKK